MIRMWPKNADILMNWEKSDLEFLQDPTLMHEGQKQYNDVLNSWNKLYRVLEKYPQFFKPESITFYKFKWVYILTTSRCFSSNWPGVCQMVPFADQLNHENINVNYDCLDPATGQSYVSKEELQQRRIKEDEDKAKDKKEFLNDLKNDLVDI